MSQPKQASKQKRRACAVPLLGAAGLSLPLASGASHNRALITHAHSHDVVVLPELRVLGIYIPSATRLGTVFGFRPSGDLQQRHCRKDHRKCSHGRYPRKIFVSDFNASLGRLVAKKRLRAEAAIRSFSFQALNLTVHQCCPLNRPLALATSWPDWHNALLLEVRAMFVPAVAGATRLPAAP
jgi:hypothetical protein